MATTEDPECDYKGHEFGAHYPDSVCIDGYLWDADSGYADPGGNFDWIYTNGGDIPCPKCNAEEYAEYASGDQDEDDDGEDTATSDSCVECGALLMPDEKALCNACLFHGVAPSVQEDDDPGEDADLPEAQAQLDEERAQGPAVP